MEYVNELDTISAGAAKKEAALKVHRLTFMEATMMVVGSTIGSGVLGLAFASRNAGWPVLLTWLVVAGFFSIISMLYVAEATLRTTRPLQLSGLAEKYVGKIGSWLIFFSVGATSFCSLIAYTSGCGKILSEFFGISLEMASCLFALGATSVVWLGLKATGVAEKYLSSGMTAMLILLVGASLFSARVPVADILYTHWMYAVPVFNIAVFCYAVQYIVPEISRGFTHEPGNSSRPSWPGPAFPSSSWPWSRWPSSSCCPSMKFRKSRPYPGAAPWGRRSSSSSSMPLPSAPC